MTEELRAQNNFARMAALLIQKAQEMGYEVVLGDAFRDPRVPYGKPKSLHKLSMALDVNLCKDGKYLRNTEDHRQLGEWWESQGGTWGGRFDDGNHYSIGYGGMK